jgi:hypothetical protein
LRTPKAIVCRVLSAIVRTYDQLVWATEPRGFCKPSLGLGQDIPSRGMSILSQGAQWLSAGRQQRLERQLAHFGKDVMAMGGKVTLGDLSHQVVSRIFSALGRLAGTLVEKEGRVVKGCVCHGQAEARARAQGGAWKGGMANHSVFPRTGQQTASEAADLWVKGTPPFRRSPFLFFPCSPLFSLPILPTREERETTAACRCFVKSNGRSVRFQSIHRRHLDPSGTASRRQKHLFWFDGP